MRESERPDEEGTAEEGELSEEYLSEESAIPTSPRAEKARTLGLLTLIGAAAAAVFWVNGSEESQAREERLPFPSVSSAPRLELPEETPVIPEPPKAEEPGTLAVRLEQKAPAQRTGSPSLADPQRLEEKRRQLEARRRSPMIVFDRAPSQPKDSRASLLAPLENEEALSGAELADFGESPSAGTQTAGGVETAQLTFLTNPDYTVPQGTLIRGVLETNVVSDLPGFTRALVSEDVYSFTGKQLVIPKGSKLIGKYQSGLARGQARIFIVWTRVLRPDGGSMLLEAPGTDELGATGVAGEVDTHFTERFGAAFLLSIVGGGLEIAAAKAADNDNSTIIREGGDGFARASEIALQDSVNIPPTIRVKSGTEIQVFVEKDLDFTDPRRPR